MSNHPPAAPRRLFARSATWGVAGVVAHMAWFFGLLAVFTGADFGLHDWVIGWVRVHRTPSQGGPDYMLAYGYIGDGLLMVFAIAVMCNVVWIALALKEHRVESRIRNSQCVKCGYQIGVSATCTECGSPVTPKASDKSP